MGEGGAVLGMVKMNRRHLGDAAHIACAGRVVDPAPEGRGGSGLVLVHVGVGVHGRLWDQEVQCGGADQYACGGVVRIALFRGAGHVAGRVRPFRVRLCRFARHVSATVIDADGGKGLNLKSLKVS